MLREIADFRAEAEALGAVLAALGEAEWRQPTQFKGWTIDDVVLHLHFGDQLAAASVADPPAFQRLLGDVRAKRASGLTSIEETRLRYGALGGGELLAAWHEQVQRLCGLLEQCDPEQRLEWAGPDMGVRMFTTARLMETWAHGQEVLDTLGLDRAPTDRLHGIATIGVRTFGWTFANRGLPVPAPVPHVRLDAPSGAVWAWQPPSTTDVVAGSALEFCQVVTQVRNVADTRLTVAGDAARSWMRIAQCFAGLPESPPMPGARFMQPRRQLLPK